MLLMNKNCNESNFGKRGKYMKEILLTILTFLSINVCFAQGEVFCRNYPESENEKLLAYSGIFYMHFDSSKYKEFKDMDFVNKFLKAHAKAVEDRLKGKIQDKKAFYEITFPIEGNIEIPGIRFVKGEFHEESRFPIHVHGLLFNFYKFKTKQISLSKHCRDEKRSDFLVVYDLVEFEKYLNGVEVRMVE